MPYANLKINLQQKDVQICYCTVITDYQSGPWDAAKMDYQPEQVISRLSIH